MRSSDAVRQRMNKHFSPSDALAIGLNAALCVMCLIGMQQSLDLVWGALLFGAGALFLLLSPFLYRWLPSREPRVETDAASIRRYSGEVVVASIRWEAIDEIAVVTNDAGPSEDDIVWVFMKADGSQGIAIGGSSIGFPALLEKLQRLPGFDHVMLLEAMGCVIAERFVVWRRPSA